MSSVWGVRRAAASGVEFGCRRTGSSFLCEARSNRERYRTRVRVITDQGEQWKDVPADQYLPITEGGGPALQERSGPW